MNKKYDLKIIKTVDHRPKTSQGSSPHILAWFSHKSDEKCGLGGDPKSEFPTKVEFDRGTVIPVQGLEGLKSEKFQKLVAAEFDIIENASQKTRRDILTAVDGNDGRAAIGMTQEKVTALLPDPLKTELFKNPYEFGSLQNGKFTHRATLICWTPTNCSGRAPLPSTSRQSSIASLTRFKSSGIDRAAVWQPFRSGTLAMRAPVSSFSIRTVKVNSGMGSLLAFPLKFAGSIAGTPEVVI